MKHRLRAGFLIITVAALILDSHTAICGAEEGLQLCLQTLIPSLFPLIFTTTMLQQYLPQSHRTGQILLCKLYRMPEGSEGLLMSGLLGGYPVGARGVAQAVADGKLSQASAQRMLVFCNACGPAFIFGVGFNLFPNHWFPWITWAIHILSGLLTARLLPVTSLRQERHSPCSGITIQEGLQRSIRSMSQICSWVILLRVLISILKKWFLWCLPTLFQTIFIGLLELTNGCISLTSVASDAVRFVLYTAFISFGGVCVALQSFGTIKGVSPRLYFPGKILQCNISILLSGVLCTFISNFEPVILMLMIGPVFWIPICLFWLRKI